VKAPQHLVGESLPLQAAWRMRLGAGSQPLGTLRARLGQQLGPAAAPRHGDAVEDQVAAGGLSDPRLTRSLRADRRPEHQPVEAELRQPEALAVRPTLVARALFVEIREQVRERHRGTLRDLAERWERDEEVGH